MKKTFVRSFSQQEDSPYRAQSSQSVSIDTAHALLNVKMATVAVTRSSTSLQHTAQLFAVSLHALHNGLRVWVIFQLPLTLNWYYIFFFGFYFFLVDFKAYAIEVLLLFYFLQPFFYSSVPGNLGINLGMCCACTSSHWLYGLLSDLKHDSVRSQGAWSRCFGQFFFCFG